MNENAKQEINLLSEMKRGKDSAKTIAEIENFDLEKTKRWFSIIFCYTT